MSDFNSGTTTMPSQDEDRRLATIRNLLSKAEATEFPEEAEAFFAKASELISRWAIDEAILWSGADRKGREQPDELQLVVHSPYLPQKAVLIGAVSRAYGCRAVRLTGGSGSKSEIVSIIGFPSDLRWVETLITSLLVQLTSAMLAQSPTNVTASITASWRRSFIVGFAETVNRRLEADRAAAAKARSANDPTSSDRAGAGGPDGSAAAGAAESGAEHGSVDASGRGGDSVALVLADRAEEVDDDFRRRHPYVRSSWASSGRSAMGRQAGERAGREASLTRGGIGGRGRLGRG